MLEMHDDVLVGWDDLSKWFKNKREWVPIDDVLEQCQIVFPSESGSCLMLSFVVVLNIVSYSRIHMHPRIVLTGGTILVDWTLQFASRPVRRDMKKLQKSMVRPIPRSESDAIVQKVRTAVYHYVLTGLSNRGDSVHLQQFYWTMLWRHKGLSRTGMDLMASLKLGVGHTYFDDEYKVEVNKALHEFT